MHTPKSLNQRAKELLTILLSKYGNIMSQTHLELGYELADDLILAIDNEQTSTGAMGVTLPHLKPFDTVLIPVTDKPVLETGKLFTQQNKRDMLDFASFAKSCDYNQYATNEGQQWFYEYKKQLYTEENLLYVWIKENRLEIKKPNSNTGKSIWDEEIIAG